MATTVEFLGYDRDGSRVWRISNGKVVCASDAQEAGWLDAQARKGATVGRTLEEYAKKWGPIVEPPERKQQ